MGCRRLLGAALARKIDARNLSEADFYCLVYNLGISSDTSTGLPTEFEQEAKARLKKAIKQLSQNPSVLTSG